MEQLVQLFEEFIMKAILMTEAVLNNKFEGGTEIETFADNRERLLKVIDQIAQRIDWNEIHESKRNDLNRQVEYIKKLDEQLITKMQEYQIEVREDIEKTFRQKENIKGYNLNDVK